MSDLIENLEFIIWFKPESDYRFFLILYFF